MGGLRRKMPVTCWTFLIGTLALCGVPPFSGFYSKDGILAVAFLRNKALFAVGVVTAVLTAFYMVRLFCVALIGRSRSDAAGHAIESQGGYDDSAGLARAGQHRGRLSWHRSRAG